MHFWTPFHERNAASILARFDESDSFRSRGLERYCTSKLLNVLWARELAGRLGGAEEVIVNIVNPSLCATQLHRSEKSFQAFIMNTVAWTAEQGGHTLADAATRHGDHQGAYISEQEMKK